MRGAKYFAVDTTPTVTRPASSDWNASSAARHSSNAFSIRCAASRNSCPAGVGSSPCGERGYLELVSHIKKTVRVPLAVKLSPFFTAPANFGLRLNKAGANALVLFSRVCESDFDIEDREIITSLKVNPPDELRVRLHWTAILHGQIDADLAVAGGIRSERDIVKCIMAGARVAFTASALLQNGVDYAGQMLTALSDWLDDHGYVSVDEMCGSMSYSAVPDPTTYQRGDAVAAFRPYDL
jgi:dihydroorotate dehydrogenase (fumarate)